MLVCEAVPLILVLINLPCSSSASRINFHGSIFQYGIITNELEITLDCTEFLSHSSLIQCAVLCSHEYNQAHRCAVFSLERGSCRLCKLRGENQILQYSLTTADTPGGFYIRKGRNRLTIFTAVKWLSEF